MIIIKLLGILDLLAASFLLAIASGIEVSLEASIIIPVFLFAKACIALGDIGGWMDLFALALIILSIFFNLPVEILYISAILIGFKGLSSLFA